MHSSFSFESLFGIFSIGLVTSRKIGFDTLDMHFFDLFGGMEDGVDGVAIIGVAALDGTGSYNRIFPPVPATSAGLRRANTTTCGSRKALEGVQIRSFGFYVWFLRRFANFSLPF